MAAVIMADSLETPKQAPAADSVVTRRNPLHVRFMDVDGVNLRVATRAGKGRPLLLFNGIGANLDLIEPIADALGETELVIFDVPGAGESPALKLPRRFTSLARLSMRLLDHLDYQAPVNVAGLNWGSSLAQQFALAYPERTNRLILAAASTGTLSLPPRLRVLRHRSTPRRYTSRDYLRRMAPELYGGLARRRPELISRHAELTRKPSLRGYLYQQYAAWLWTSAHRLPRLRCPVLIMAGDDDPVVPLINSRLVYWLIPKSYLHIVRGGGHLFMLFRANECAAVVRRFISDRRYDGTDPEDYMPRDGQASDD